MSSCTRTHLIGRAAALLLAITAAMTISLGACSSSGSTPAAGAPPASGGSSVGPAQTSASDAGDVGDEASGTPTYKRVDVCALDPVGTVAQTTGKKLTKGVPQTVGQLALGSYGCAYNTDLDDDAVEVTVFTSNVDDLWNALTSDTKRTLTPVGGLGEKAFYDNDSTLYAKKGAYVVQVNGLTDTSQASQLATPVLGAL
ncbi:MAG: hypothetical protein ABI112_11205 [Terracoccus sp.]